MDRLDAMSVLVAAVEAGSLSAASRKLGVPLTTVSRKVADLEAHLRTQLLRRESRPLAPTDAGRAYLAACREILEDVGEAERTAAGEYSAPRGELAISAPIVFGRLHALPIVTEFLAAFADVAARLVLSDRVVDLTEEQLDVAIRIGELGDSGLVARRIGMTRRVVCASPAYLSAHGEPKNPGDLARHACITRDAPSFAGTWTFRRDGVDETIAIRSRLTISTAEAALDAAAASLGVTRLYCYQAAQAVHDGRLALLLTEFEPSAVPISLVYAPRARMAQKLRAFLDFAAPRLKERVHRNPI